MNSFDQPKFDQAGAEIRLDRFLENELSASEAKELTTYCVENPEFLEFARKNLDLDRTLRFWNEGKGRPIAFDSETLRALFGVHHDGLTLRMNSSLWQQVDEAEYLDLDLEKLVSLAANSETIVREKDVVEPATRSPRPYSKQDASWISPKVLLAVLIALFVFGIYTEFFSERSGGKEKPFRPLARITAVIDCVPDEAGESFKEGRLLENERIRFQSGQMQLELDSGVNLILEGPAELVLRGRDTVFCSLGQVSATVSPAGRGFKMETPYATIVDLGTQFFVSVGDEKTAVHVVKGLVEVSRNSTEIHPLSEGNAIEYDRHGGMKQFEADSKTFIPSAVWLATLDRDLERRKAVWERTETRLTADPNLLARLDDAVPSGSSRVGGRWEEAEDTAKALRFRSVRDYATLSIPGEHRNLTLLAVVRIDDMKNIGNLICVENTFLETPGGFSWQVDSRGAVLFHVHADDGIRRFDTGPLLRRRDWRTWITLAVVVDADRKEVSHFFDGKKVASFPWENPRPLHFKEGIVGNHLPNDKDRSVRFWNGDIDSLYLYSRPFSEEELKNARHNH